MTCTDIADSNLFILINFCPFFILIVSYIRAIWLYQGALIHFQAFVLECELQVLSCKRHYNLLLWLQIITYSAICQYCCFCILVYCYVDCVRGSFLCSQDRVDHVRKSTLSGTYPAYSLLIQTFFLVDLKCVYYSQDFTQCRVEVDDLRSHGPAFWRLPTLGLNEYESNLHSFLSNFHLELWALMFLFVLYFTSSAIYYTFL